MTIEIPHVKFDSMQVQILERILKNPLNHLLSKSVPSLLRINYDSIKSCLLIMIPNIIQFNVTNHCIPVYRVPYLASLWVHLSEFKTFLKLTFGKWKTKHHPRPLHQSI